MRVLGTTINEKMTWTDTTIRGKESLLNQLKIRNYTLSRIVKYMNPIMRLKYANAIFKGKYIFAIDNWGGCGLTERSLIQKQQNRAAKIVLGKEYENKTDEERLKTIKWMNIEKQIKYTSHIKAYKWLNDKDDGELANIILPNMNKNRLQTHKKLAPKPKILAKSKITRGLIRNRIYQYNNLPGKITTAKTLEEFKKELKIHMNKTCDR